MLIIVYLYLPYYYYYYFYLFSIQLKKELEENEVLLKHDEDQYNNELTIINNKIDQLSLLLHQYSELLQVKDKYIHIENNKKISVLKIKFLLQARQITLLQELIIIYPIEKISNNNDNNSSISYTDNNTSNINILNNESYSIRGVEIPYDFQSKDDELLAAGLGYIVHLLLLISKYLEVSKNN